MRSNRDQVVVRCLALIRRLLRGETASEELQAISALHNDPYESLSDKALERRFEDDLRRVREWFGCEVHYDASTKEYCMESVTVPLVDLPDEALRGLAFLQATFSDRAVPMRSEVSALFESIHKVLPEDRWADLRKQRGQVEIDLKQRDTDEIPDRIKEDIQVACAEQRLIEFEYAARRADGETVWHRAEPYTFYFQDGHYYLDAYSLESRRGANPPTNPYKLISFRVGNIRSLQKLPNKFTRRQCFQTDTLIYQLSAHIAQRGVTELFPNSRIEPQADGSAIVYAESINLFVDVRKLLHYGAACRILGNDRAVQEMRRIVSDISQLYS